MTSCHVGLEFNLMIDSLWFSQKISQKSTEAQTDPWAEQHMAKRWRETPIRLSLQINMIRVRLQYHFKSTWFGYDCNILLKQECFFNPSVSNLTFFCCSSFSNHHTSCGCDPLWFKKHQCFDCSWSLNFLIYCCRSKLALADRLLFSRQSIFNYAEMWLVAVWLITKYARRFLGFRRSRNTCEQSAWANSTHQ